MAQWVKQQAWSLLWHGFDPWPGNFCITRYQKKKKKKSRMLLLRNTQALTASRSLLCKPRPAPEWNSVAFQI